MSLPAVLSSKLYHTPRRLSIIRGGEMRRERGVHGERGAHGERGVHGERGGKLLKKFFPRSPLSKLKNREIGHADALKKSKSVIRNWVRVHHFKSFKLRSFFEANRRGLGSDQKLFRPLQKQGVNTSVSAEHWYEHVF